MNDLQDMRGFDPNASLAMDQSIMGEHSPEKTPFNADESVVHGYNPPQPYQRSASMD